MDSVFSEENIGTKIIRCVRVGCFRCWKGLLLNQMGLPFLFEPKREPFSVEVPILIRNGERWGQGIRLANSKKMENFRMDSCRDNVCKDLCTARMRGMDLSMYTIYRYNI